LTLDLRHKTAVSMPHDLAYPNPPSAAGYDGYELRQQAQEDVELTHVGRASAAGEYLRRFWTPIALTQQLGDAPLRLRVLGEDLVLFRDKARRLGLLHLHCCHRRASLEYGIVAEQGIRCCYHGWLFDVDGAILETPGEPATSQISKHRRQGAYPVFEYGGIAFAYLGPAPEQPEFPIYDTFRLPGVDLVPYLIDYPCNWLQVTENPMDPFHSVFLHTRTSRAHFNAAWGAMPIVEWHVMPDKTGVWLTNTRVWGDYLWVRTAESLTPTFAQPPDIYQNPDREKFFTRVGISKWVLPVDNTHCQIIGWRHFSDELDLEGKGDRARVGINKVDFLGQTGNERSYAEAQREPSDYEAQAGQGPITIHALENLGKTDTGVAMLRRQLRRGIRAVADGLPVSRPRARNDGTIPTMAGDVIIKAPRAASDPALQAELGRRIGAIIAETAQLDPQHRRLEIERRSRQVVE
jgi:nitrite reductase/ring-hydroxylating ferredoxin subunit